MFNSVFEQRDVLDRHPFVHELLEALHSTNGTNSFSFSYRYPLTTSIGHFHDRHDELSNHLCQDFLRRTFHLASFSDRTESQRRNEEVTAISISRYSFVTLPQHTLELAFPNLIHLRIFSNVSFHSDGLKSILKQLPQLELLQIHHCPNLKSLSPFAELLDEEPIQRNILSLKALSFRYCGISDPNSQLWDKIMYSLSQSTGPLESFEITGTDITHLPPSISYLKNSLSELIVSDNPKFKHVPDEIGMLYTSTQPRYTIPYLRFSNNAKLEYLPSTIGRLHDSVQIVISHCPRLKQPSKCYRGSIRSMRTYFMLHRIRLFRGIVKLSILLNRARMRANERLYRPGAIGYKLCEDRFIELQKQR